jgi:peptidoglycan/LPS O-acetylase OafA/YrhL
VSKPRFHIPSLDGLRTFSFGIVFLAHAGLGYIIPGGFGVTVFFFLSGFLITTLMRLEWNDTQHVSLKNFYIRRALRILPPFYLVLAVATSLTAAGVLRGHLIPRAVMAQVLHYANFWVVGHGSDGFAPGTGVYWSLAVEEHFYLLFPLFYLFLQRLQATPRQQAMILLALCALIFAWRCTLVLALHSPENRTYVASDTRFDSILFGCALAVYGNPVLDPSTKSEKLWKYLFLPLGLLGLTVTFLFRGPHFRETFRYSLQGLALIPVFVCALRYSTWGPMQVLNLRPIAFVGVLSYSLYLIHQVMFFALSDRLAPSIGVVACAVITLVLSLALAWLVQITIEKPCARLRRRFSA